MPWSDFLLVIRWWGTVFLFGAAAYPLTRRLGLSYFFAKAVGMALVSWIVYVLGTLRLFPFSPVSILLALGITFFLGYISNSKKDFLKNIPILLLEEFFFLSALLLWSWVKAHEPSIRGLEKFMDYGFMQSILNSRYFPPADMWYAGNPINYYYFGHLVTAVLTKFSGLDLTYTFNLMLATIFALTFTMSYAIGKKIGGGFLTAFLVTFAGNMQTIYAFTRGYTGDNVAPFWQLGWTLKGLSTYWYANATRFIPFTIHEFPSYSFVVSDVHGHVLSIPFVLLTIALLIHTVSYFSLVFYGFLVGVLLMTNVLDGPVYFGLLLVVLVIRGLRDGRFETWKFVGIASIIVEAGALLASFPFLKHFNSFVSGLAVNCPPSSLANNKFGPLLFETVEKCQKSPIWMLWLLWGFFIYCGIWFIINKFKIKKSKIKMEAQKASIEQLLIVFFLFAIALIIFPEFFYFKDIYPAHFRSNTMFKLGYQAFILFSIVSAYTIVKLSKNKIFLTLLIPQLFLVSIYPFFSVRSYFGNLQKYQGLYGLNWLKREYQDDYQAINWLKERAIMTNSVIVEADGDSYTDYNRFSAFTGLPTVVGWAVHEWLWRGSYDVVSPRRNEVRTVYESEDLASTRQILAKYNTRYVIVGKLERDKFTSLMEGKFSRIGREVFRSGATVIYEIFPRSS